MLYKIKRFKKEHLKNFDARDSLKPELEFLDKHLELQEEWETLSPVFTLFADEKPILIYGLFSSGTGTYMCMVYAAKNIDKHIFRVVRCLYKYVEDYVGYDVRRFEAHCTATDTASIRLGKFFGFEIIGYRRQAGVAGEDQVILERLWRKG